ncbi:MAG: glycine cleavage system protein H [Desulfobacterales bacterium]|nr:MAG: glycine cleavage system protein H [Desulfobacterales bacterium]
MAEGKNKEKRSQVGIGSTYRKGIGQDLGSEREIGAVMGGQVWMIKPDQKAKAAHPCLWMQTGVVKFKNCDNYYDCTTCKYDHAMGQKATKGRQLTWQESMRRRPAMDRVCRHSLTQRINTRICAYDYECSKCDFDQYFEDVWTTKNKSMPFEIQQVKGFDVPMGYYFHNGHAWARIESGGYIRIGLDDFSLKLLGQADALDLPLMGKELDQGKVGWGLRRKKNQADVLSPVDGVIVEVNSNVRENPQVANREPYGDGWLFMIRTPDVKGTMNKLMTDQNSLAWINEEVSHLENMIEEVAGPLAADGGYLADDIYGNLPDLGWENLTKKFLKT